MDNSVEVDYEVRVRPIQVTVILLFVHVNHFEHIFLHHGQTCREGGCKKLVSVDEPSWFVLLDRLKHLQHCSASMAWTKQTSEEVQDNRRVED